MSTTALARMECDAFDDAVAHDQFERERDALRRLLEVAKQERIDAGEECVACGNRDAESLAEEAPCGVPTFKCYRCYAAWLDTRNRRGNPQCDWQCDDERDAS